MGIGDGTGHLVLRLFYLPNRFPLEYICERKMSRFLLTSCAFLLFVLLVSVSAGDPFFLSKFTDPCADLWQDCADQDPDGCPADPQCAFNCPSIGNAACFNGR